MALIPDTVLQQSRRYSGVLRIEIETSDLMFTTQTDTHQTGCARFRLFNFFYNWVIVMPPKLKKAVVEDLRATPKEFHLLAKRCEGLEKKNRALKRGVRRCGIPWTLAKEYAVAFHV